MKLSDLTLCHGEHPAVHHLSGEFAPGALTAVVGPNGAGKSTLLQGLLGLHPPRTGRVEGVRAGELAYLPQAAAIDRSFPLTAWQLLLSGVQGRRGAFGRITPAQRERARDALQAVGLAGFESRLIGELSVGQFQRLLFARVLLQDARQILLDEPFNAIDSKTTSDLLALLARWGREQRTVVAVLHDLDTVRAHFPHTLLLAREPIAWGDTADVLRPENLLKARQMAEAWNPLAAWCRQAA